MAGIEIASIPRTQDFSIIKHNEDNKGLVDQGNILHVREEQERAKAEDVVDTTQSEWYQKRQDASEESDSTYAGDGGRRRPKQGKKQPEARVVVKGRPGGFDIKI